MRIAANIGTSQRTDPASRVSRRADLREALSRVGLEAPEAMEVVGAESAWLLLDSAGMHPNIELLFEIETAIQAQDWTNLPASRRFELLHFAAQHAA